MKATDQPEPSPAAESSLEERHDGIYRRMDFLHLAEAIGLEHLAATVRRFVGADFEWQRDEFVECMVAAWDGNQVIIAHPLERILPEYVCGGQLTENNAAATITHTVKRPREDSRAVGPGQSGLVASIATAVASTFGIEVLHSKTWHVDSATTTVWNQRYRQDSVTPRPETPEVFASGWQRIALVTTIESLRPKYDGPLDFMHVVHPRAIVDKRRPFPLMRGLTAEIVDAIQPTCTVLGPIEVPLNGRLLRGELVSIPYAPEEMFAGLSEARDALLGVLDYAEHRQSHFVSLGALIPSITKQGRLLKRARPSMAITTGHGFTAVTIAKMVEEIEKQIGSGGVVAVMGAAGSTGRAALGCMIRRNPSRRVLAVDLPQQVSKIPEIPGWNPEVHRLTTLKEEIKDAAIVVCVTNALGGILDADDFGPNAVILDDAQPENVDQSVLATRPDLTVVKCLTRIPGLHCPFEMGLFAPEHLDPEVNFTCLAEIILSAAERHPESCVVGDPTDEQLDYLEHAASRHGVGPAKFFSFPSLGSINLRGRDSGNGSTDRPA
jgi:predicted amino acid dehydrogenase